MQIYPLIKLAEGGEGGGGGGGAANLATWAQADNNDKIPEAKLPAINPLSQGTDLPTPANSEFGKLYGIGLEEGTGDAQRIETQSISYLKHRDPNTARMYVGRIDDNVYGYANGQGGVLSPEGLAPEFVTSFITELDRRDMEHILHGGRHQRYALHQRRDLPLPVACLRRAVVE